MGRMSSTALAAGSGFGLGLALIVAIGAQNAFVLRQGLRGEHVAGVVAVCALSEQVPWAVTGVRLAGAAFLAGYGALAARRALRPVGALQAEAAERTPLPTVLLTAAALTWLNPHVYLDTVVLLGAVAAAQGDLRWAFGAGAGAASVLWFPALGAGARLLRPVFARPAAWRVLDALIAVVMLLLAVGLLRG
jgi:L-lysine exporter family protein LysE/ArgO